MAKKTETYPAGPVDLSVAVLDEYREAVAAGRPLPIEYLTDVLTSGQPQNVREYVAAWRDADEAAAKLAEEAEKAGDAWAGPSLDEDAEAKAAAAFEEKEAEPEAVEPPAESPFDADNPAPGPGEEEAAPAEAPAEPEAPAEAPAEGAAA